MELVIKVCDVCHDPKREASRYEVTKNGKSAVEKDLCSVHGRALDVILGDAKPAGRPPKKGATRAAGVRVTNVEDIEKKKRGKAN